MSYEKESAKQSLQNAPNLMQELGQVPGFLGVIAVAIFFGIAGTIPLWMVPFISIAAIIWKLRADRERAIQEAKARAASWANLAGPVVVSSLHPGETVAELQARAAEWRENLKLSGNPYWSIIPIIEKPYTPILYRTEELNAGWSIYRKQVAALEHDENVKWYEGKCPPALKAVFANSVLGAPKKEDDLD